MLTWVELLPALAAGVLEPGVEALSSEQPTRTSAAAAMPMPAVTIFIIGSSLRSLRPDGVVVRQVQASRIATDPNNLREYGCSVVDSTAPDSGSDVGDPQAIIDAEIVPDPVPVTPPDTGYTPDGVPTFEAVREKIENRYGTAIGSSELAAETLSLIHI